MGSPTQLALAIAASADPEGQDNLAADMHKDPRVALAARWERADDATRWAASRLADELEAGGIRFLALGDARYPERLATIPKPPALLYLWGNEALLAAPSIGMCGSRDVSDRGLQAARACGEAVARQGLTVISGYAKGVDTETHLAALREGGTTIIVLAEGITHFRHKKVFGPAGLDPERTLVISQFAPTQTWNVGAAMTRNAVIAGLGQALVVIEAGETGGTLSAGVQALRMHRPVLALNFANAIPAGNKILFEKGAKAVGTPRELYEAIANIDASVRQMSLPLV